MPVWVAPTPAEDGAPSRHCRGMKVYIRPSTRDPRTSQTGLYRACLWRAHTPRLKRIMCTTPLFNPAGAGDFDVYMPAGRVWTRPKYTGVYVAARLQATDLHFDGWESWKQQVPTHLNGWVYVQSRQVGLQACANCWLQHDKRRCCAWACPGHLPPFETWWKYLRSLLGWARPGRDNCIHSARSPLRTQSTRSIKAVSTVPWHQEGAFGSTVPTDCNTAVPGHTHIEERNRKKEKSRWESQGQRSSCKQEIETRAATSGIFRCWTRGRFNTGEPYAPKPECNQYCQYSCQVKKPKPANAMVIETILVDDDQM